MSLINPLDIKEEDLPLIVLADNLRSFIAWGIRKHTKGQYVHIMSMHRTGFFASQGWMYKEVPIRTYMEKGYRLKFWKCKNLTTEAREEWLNMIETELKAPWWERKYDIGGIFGQLIFLRFINNPFTRYCSERVAPKIRKFFRIVLRKHPSPSDCNKALTTSPDKAEVLGHYFWDYTRKQ